ncbi:7-carboxy-7-deazaguanine synthase [Bathymodiolus platifrons methanotrophic gill symbiont]|uniref:7-carboxy-7-deazaguanine synthase QueE n=1 Tax=Bathymodiolus platifrons methanotrophic gill symbiont TaxID=113268 RepID=UPI000B40F609|nr:7-carboxy-7-deazaguanine synthase QueE [Bathymodiolus platifrons methanotrophic gill symbiont]MCK5870881.1 7-carboxy-7-deazaguanine synthase QueE [Methyloprofundus sp.]TXK97043.1 7-carboxy-7-deazaguanine synthase QueE [Methylococcaceae bacterium CS4]TXK99383.1 7-carboxy-7-deazaguanine synthase QueE [Methylococcaceae bacterium CS5]TXL05024.1 7-carboxy-7-deazaguanine synthase QueE [Methylococcaceae bacterium CS1]TXL05466.1 7-carboxy-7-deazaguanine synthase QueE [Methylococcaceae bacterium CS3
MKSDNLRISEIFYSLQGESRTVGLPTIFIRLTGCPLRCQYCDTSYAFSGGETRSIADILEQLSQYKTHYITVTGGEPLAQPACLELLRQLADKDYCVSLETSGAIDISSVDARVVKVMDLKTPASAEEQRNLYSNLQYLTVTDQLKFVICNAEDYAWSKAKIAEYQLERQCEILFSPSMGEQDPAELAEWILRDQLAVRFQLQLHKILWGNIAGK